MIDTISSTLAPYYLQIKFVHLLFVAMWFWSTSVAYTYYLVPLFRAWQQNPQALDRIHLRNWAMERFDDGAILEHIAFPIVLLTGILLMLISGWSPDAGWFALKLVLVVLVFLPIEIVDYHLAHFGGNKQKLRESGAIEEYEDILRLHWKFLVLSTPIVVVSITLVVFLAITKPF